MQLGSLDQPAGHIICGFLLMLFGAGFFKLGIPHGDDIIVAGFTIIGMAMKGLGNAKQP
jgi:hypothetical protein